MSYLFDTNVLLRLVQRQDTMHLDALNAYIALRKQNQELCITSQNLIEFWAVATRPATSNGLGLTIADAFHEVSLLKSLFRLKLDTSDVYAIWEQLAIQHQVIGKQVHDTRLVAVMIAHHIDNLLTFNTDDFKRFSEITVINPRHI